jgi:anthranilate phosphoribosyltransferase
MMVVNTGTKGAAQPDWCADAIRDLLRRVLRGHAERSEVMSLLAAASAQPLREDVTFAFVHELRSLTPPRALAHEGRLVNIVGTGQGRSTFNISTAAAIVASAAGARVLKSGSAGQSSRCGAIDVLRALGITLPHSEQGLTRMLADTGIAFVAESHYSMVLLRMAALLHPMRFKDVGRFINTIGPLLCPYRVDAQLTGVSQLVDLPVLASVAQRAELPNFLFVCSHEGLDELCDTGEHSCHWVHPPSEEREWKLPPSRGGKADLDQLAGSDPSTNARRLHDVLAGQVPGIARDTVALNAGALLALAGVVSSHSDGVELATRVLCDGVAARQLRRVVEWRAGLGGAWGACA